MIQLFQIALLLAHTSSFTHHVRVGRQRQTSYLQSSPHTITSTPSPHDPNSNIHTLTFAPLPLQSLGSPPITFKSNLIGRQASSSVLTSQASTVLLTTVCHAPPRDSNIDFLPLSVEHQERFSSIGSTSGGYNKRDGRPSDSNILTCRLIDRPLRPIVRPGWTQDSQILSWVMSYDAKEEIETDSGCSSIDVLAILGAAVATRLSGIPTIGSTAAVEVACFESGQIIVNPSKKEMAKSLLRLVVAGSEKGILMVEGQAIDPKVEKVDKVEKVEKDVNSTASAPPQTTTVITEATMVKCIGAAFTAIKVLCAGIDDFQKVAGAAKRDDLLNSRDPLVALKVKELYSEEVNKCFSMREGKEAQSVEIYRIYDHAWETIGGDGAGSIENAQKNDVKLSVKELMSKTMYNMAKDDNLRVDGRGFGEVRPISIVQDLLPKVHGHALFTRGETQALATATLGDAGMNQKLDNLEGKSTKRFYLQYSFPPSSVGETGRVGTPGRREIGHGALAEKSLKPSLPKEEDFPYSIRLESLITESHGSSSMASVCGGSLAMMDAGVPVKSVVGGVAMGMLFDPDPSSPDTMDDDAIVLTDIMGVEDALGAMDFKVAGDEHGITAFQLDIKCEGLSVKLLEKALEDARVGRLHIIERMKEAIPGPRAELPESVPKLRSFFIKPESIGRVIGPGGKVIRAIIEDYDLTNMDVGEDGTVQISGFNATKMAEVEKYCGELVAEKGGRSGGGGGGDRPVYDGPDPIEGTIYKACTITGVHNFGVFAEILPGLEGLCHVSELHSERVNNVEGWVMARGMEVIDVMYLGKNEKGRHSLSRKKTLGGGGGGATTTAKPAFVRNPNRVAVAQDKELVSPMSADEVQIIEEAIQEAVE